MVILNIPVNSDLDAEKKPITFNETLFRYVIGFVLKFKKLVLYNVFLSINTW